MFVGIYLEISLKIYINMHLDQHAIIKPYSA